MNTKINTLTQDQITSAIEVLKSNGITEQEISRVTEILNTNKVKEPSTARGLKIALKRKCPDLKYTISDHSPVISFEGEPTEEVRAVVEKNGWVVA